MDARKLQAIILLAFAVAMVWVAAFLYEKDGGVSLMFACLGSVAAIESYRLWPRKKWRTPWWLR